MSERLIQLAKHIRLPHDPFSSESTEEMIEVSVPTSTAAVLYERVRNSFDYQEEHLLRRNAISRMLKRYLGVDAPLSSFAGDLLKELVWARYLPNKTIPISLGERLAAIIGKYEPLFAIAERHPQDREYLIKWLLDVIATEVEAVLAPAVAEEHLVSYMYEETKKRIDWDPALPVSEEERDLRLYIAIHKMLLKSNPAILRYKVLTLYYPDWGGKPSRPDLQAEVEANFLTIVRAIDGEIAHPFTDRLMRLVRRKTGVYRVIGDILSDPDIDLRTDGAATFMKAGHKALEARTINFSKRLRRTVTRSIVFLFLTKMLVAIIMEVPYDLLFEDHIPWQPLAVNIFFPPIFLALISLTVSIPKEDNAQNYAEALSALWKEEDHPLLHTRVKHEKRSRWQSLFAAMYTVLFLGVYGAIAFALSQVGFHWLSISLFLFFLSLVAFFGIRIRWSTRDIVVSDSRSGWIGTAFDILLLPIVRAGQWLSLKIADINVFIYFFDFIVEAPVKVIIELAEGWLSFIRQKKEEI
ncbi:hypothetical protein KBC55_02355 [Patescibacteria group bacterium]|nr:hypothetical protein [Patescibacteria group bacterium]